MTVKLDSTPDFGGWATKADLECADGLTIGHDAFKDMDGVRVPLVYQHGHKSLDDVLGHAILENRGEGVYAHCFFNENPNAILAKGAVQHGDLTMMSIYANRLRKNGDTVTHGIIREVSLVQAGANPGALIDPVSVRHSDGYGGYEERELEDEAVITTGLTLQHSATAVVEEVAPDLDLDHDQIWGDMSPEQKEFTRQLLEAFKNLDVDSEAKPEDTEAKPDDAEPTDDGAATEAAPDDAEPAADPDAGEGSEAGDTGDGAAAPDSAPADAPAQHDAFTNTSKGSEMTTTTGEKLTHNIFDQEAVIKHGLPGRATNDRRYELAHSESEQLLADAFSGRHPSLRDVVKDYKLQHGIENIDIMFPDAKAVSNTPEWVKRRTEWVDRVINGAKHTPFSRIKSLTADITLDQARARGYIKGALKKEEFFAVAKRVTTPQTIYKKQKLDRDDILDITDFDVVVWLKGEMRLMLDEELGRAVLIGDGRSNADDDKILEDKIRPIARDHELFQTTVFVEISEASEAEKIVDEILMNRRYYRGSGNPDLFTTEVYISQMLNVKDNTGRRIYANISELASVLRVNSIIPVEVMEEEPGLVAIMVNMVDYTIGTDRGGNVALFDDFDIDYNQYKYLIETRCSGALTKPKSALVVRRAPDNSTRVTAEAPDWDGTTKQVTVQTTTGITYKAKNNGAVLTEGAPVQLADGQTLTVIAVPSSDSYYLASNEVDEFTFTYDEGLVDGPH